MGWHGTLYVDGYIFVYGSDGWYYYAELDARGDYVASPYKIGIDDPPGYNPAVTPGRSSPTATVVQQRSWGAVEFLERFDEGFGR